MGIPGEGEIEREREVMKEDVKGNVVGNSIPAAYNKVYENSYIFVKLVIQTITLAGWSVSVTTNIQGHTMLSPLPAT